MLQQLYFFFQPDSLSGSIRKYWTSQLQIILHFITGCAWVGKASQNCMRHKWTGKGQEHCGCKKAEKKRDMLKKSYVDRTGSKLQRTCLIAWYLHRIWGRRDKRGEDCKAMKKFIVRIQSEISLTTNKSRNARRNVVVLQRC